jgi:hypothetical protein
MSHLAGLVFDVYDDTTGDTLKSVIPDAGNIPDFIKEAEMISPDRSRSLPDDAYSLVMINGGKKFRKYASVDKGNTALSVLYFLKQAHLLPDKAVKVAAHNLIEACNRFGMEAPNQLKQAAAPDPKRDSKENPMLGQPPSDGDVKSRTNVDGVDGTNYMSSPPSLREDGEKEEYSVEKTAGAFGDSIGEVVTKHKNWRVSPYVDMEDWEPGAHLVKKASAPQRTLLGGKYPVDSYDQVKTAEAYFTAGVRRFHPRQRREFCVKLAARMNELCIEVPDLIEKYASPGYGVDSDAYVSYRRGFVHEEFHPALDLLLEKRAQVSPDTYAEALCEFDQMTNLHYQWDSQIPDPWSSTFGPSMSKVAEDDWVWDEGGVRIDEQDLENLSMNGYELVKKSFGEDFAKQFSKSPKTFFNALPTPNKTVLGRLAMDRHGGTCTE